MICQVPGNLKVSFIAGLPVEFEGPDTEHIVIHMPPVGFPFSLVIGLKAFLYLPGDACIPRGIGKDQRPIVGAGLLVAPSEIAIHDVCNHPVPDFLRRGLYPKRINRLRPEFLRLPGS